MYRIGDTLLYGTEGVCKIEEICEMKIGGAKAEYYVLQPVYREGSKVFVPVGNELLTAKMRPILTAEEIGFMLRSVCEEDTPWIENAADRKAEFQKNLRSDDRMELLRMLRMLYLRRKKLQENGKRLRTNDDQMLRDAQKLLGEEFAPVLGISRREVPEYLYQHMVKMP